MKKASEFLYKPFAEYLIKKHPNMKIQDNKLLINILRNNLKNNFLNEMETFFKSNLPEVEFDKDTIIKMSKVGKFLTDHTNLYFGGDLTPNLLTHISEHYNMTLSEQRKLLSIFEMKLGEQNINLYLYDILEKYINLREHKLERILKK